MTTKIQKKKASFILVDIGHQTTYQMPKSIDSQVFIDCVENCAISFTHFCLILVICVLLVTATTMSMLGK